MTFITAAKNARKIVEPVNGRGITISLSEHADKRMADRLTHVAGSDVCMDKWAVAAIYNALVAKTFTTTAPLDYYDDGVKREDDNCAYAVAELRPGFPVCIVFALSGREVIIITVLWPLDKGGAREARTHGRARTQARQAARVSNIGGQGRMRRAG